MWVRLALIAVVLIGVFAGYRFWSMNQALARMGDVTLGAHYGPDDARDVLVEFMDYRCSYCREIGPAVKSFVERNPDIKVVIRHYPVFGAPSVFEARIALAAARQGRFDDVHDYLLSRETPMNEAELQRMTQTLGLDQQQLELDMQSEAVTAHLLETMDAVQLFGINQTPSFLVNRQVLVPRDFLPVAEDFERAFGRDPQRAVP